jgi:hypothetical protein
MLRAGDPSRAGDAVVRAEPQIYWSVLGARMQLGSRHRGWNAMRVWSHRRAGRHNRMSFPILVHLQTALTLQWFGRFPSFWLRRRPHAIPPTSPNQTEA